MENSISRFMGAIIAFAMLCAGMFVVLRPQTAHADDGTLPIAQYVTSTGNAACATNPESATYSGTVNLSVPMSNVLASHESDMQQAGASGWYPHGLEGRNKIAYISYDVTFPEDVNVGNITVANTVSYINSNRITHTVNGRTVNFRFYLNDVNWQTIYNLYMRDKADPNAHKIDIQIPYTTTISSYDDAARYDAEKVTSQGSFSFYPSGTAAIFGYGLVTYTSDTASVPFTTNTVACFTPPVQKTTNWVADDGTVLKTAVTGKDFEAQETFADYDFVNAEVSADGNTKTYTYKKKMKATDVIPEGEQHATLTADLLGSVDGAPRTTQHDSILMANSKNSVFAVTGTLHVNDLVKGQMGDLIRKYDESPQTFDHIVLSKMDFAFESVLTLPEQMEFSAQGGDAIKATLEGAQGFEVESTDVNGKQATVTIGLKDVDKITTFAQLKAIIDGLNDDLSVTLDGIRFTSDAQPATPYTITGRTDGSFSAIADINNVVRHFTYTYSATQKPEEADSTGHAGLSLTVEYIKPVQEDLLADLRGAEKGKTMDTEHDKVYVADSQDSMLDIEGVLHVSDSIKNQMKDIEKRYHQLPSNFQNIKVSAIDFGFTAKLTLPEGMEYGSTDISKLQLIGAPGFTISQDPSQTFYKGRVLTVRFSLANPAALTTYEEVNAVVQGVEDSLVIRVPDVKFTTDSQPGTNYTIKGEVSGNFNATATLPSRSIPFAFEWNGVQKADESDAVAPNGINFTVQYKASAPKPEPKPVPTKKPEPKRTLAKTGVSLGYVSIITLAIMLAGASLIRVRKH